MTDKELLGKLYDFDLISKRIISKEEADKSDEAENAVVVHEELGNVYKISTFDDERITQKILLGIYKNLRIIKNIAVFYFAASLIGGAIWIGLLLASLK